MKKLILVILVINLYADISIIIKKIDELNNFNYNFILINYNPFICKNIYKNNLVKNLVVRKKSIFILKAIFNNQAFINNKWYKVGDKINGFIIYKITDKEIFLKKGKKIVKIKLKEDL